MAINNTPTTKGTGTKIVKCACTHPHQDKVYGAGKRLANKTMKKNGEKFLYRCTVCKTLH